METWLDRTYARHPRQYLFICLLCLAGGMGLVMVPIATAVTGRYEGLTLAQSGLTLALSVPCIPLSVALGALLSRRQLRLVHRWITQPREGQPVEQIRSAAHKLPLRLLIGTAIASCATSEPIGITTTLSQLHRLHPQDFLLLTIGGLFFAIWGLIAAWIWLELCFRPVLVDLSRADPSAEILEGNRRLGVATRLSIALGGAFTVGACYAGALAAKPSEGFNGLWKLLLISVGVSAAFGLVLVPLCSSLLLGPVRALMRGTESVAKGELDVRLPLTGHDELAELTASFNGMVDGLRERADLRATNAVLITELRESRERIVTAADTARRQVERDLHDGAQQHLVTARLKLGLLRRQLAAGTDTTELLATLDTDLETGLSELRELAHGIYPALLDDDGLPGALQYAASRAAIPTTLTCENESRYSPKIETAVYFSCLEALQNATKHAGPEARATISIRERDGHLHFEVADDGVGFDPARLARTSGLQNVADRVGALGGRFEVRSRPGQGARQFGSVPIA